MAKQKSENNDPEELKKRIQKLYIMYHLLISADNSKKSNNSKSE